MEKFKIIKLEVRNITCVRRISWFGRSLVQFSAQTGCHNWNFSRFFSDFSHKYPYSVTNWAATLSFHILLNLLIIYRSVRNRCCSVGIVTRLRARRSSNRCSVPDRGKRFFSSPKRPDWLCGQNVEFLGAFEKLRKATVNFVMPVCLSVRPHGTTRLPLDDFHSIWYLRIFMKICRENWSFIKIWQTWILMYAYDSISLSSS